MCTETSITLGACRHKIKGCRNSSIQPFAFHQIHLCYVWAIGMMVNFGCMSTYSFIQALVMVFIHVATHYICTQLLSTI